MPAEKKKVLLIDTFGLLYKLFFTLPSNMKSPDGKPVNAAYGFARLLMKIYSEMKPDYLVAAMESRTPTFRHDEYPEYKAHRDKIPDDLKEQLPIVEELLEAVGLVPAFKDGYEADDIIGTMSRTAAGKGFAVQAITGDRDLLQLVSDDVEVLLSKKGVTDLDVYDRDKVKEKEGVYPEQIPDKKGLEGDSSDNIPGVPGVGKKTAAKLLDEYSTIEEIYDSLDDIKSKALRKKLEENRDTAFLSRKLGRIACEVPLDFEIEDFGFRDIDKIKLAKLFRKYAFKTLIDELDLAPDEIPEPPGVAEQLSSKYRLVCEEAELEEFIGEAKKRGRLCIDLETMGLNPYEDSIVGYSLAYEPGDAIYVPVRHETSSGSGGQTGMFDEEPEQQEAACGIGKQISPGRALEIIRAAIENPEIECLGHNLKFDQLMLMNAGAKIKNIACDTFIASYLLDPHERNYSLKNVASRLLDINMRTYEDVAGRGKDQVAFSKVPIDIATDYACADVDTVLRIEPILRRELDEGELTDVFEKIEMPLVPVLAEMEMAGIALNSHALKESSIKMEKKEKELLEKIRGAAGENINPKSPKQVAELLFDRLGLPKIQKRSTDIHVLEQLQDRHEVVPLIIQFRHLSKLRGTYIDALPEAVNKRTGRIHTSFNQTLAATGRLSSSNPNLQNIPIRTDEGREIRRAFVPGSESQALLSADYSQVEVRILAHMSGDPKLIESFKNNEDIHRRTASEVFGVPQEDVNRDQRAFAKIINFGIIYGKTPYGLSQEMDIGRQEAAEFIEKYFSRYPKIRDFIEQTKEESARDGYVKTLFGRRRYIPEVQSQNATQREAGFRAAVNTRIQGTAADIIKLAMIKAHHLQKSGELPALMLLQVHDELVFEVEKDNLETAAKVVRQTMEQAAEGWVDFSVSLETDIKAGPNWLDMEPVEI